MRADDARQHAEDAGFGAARNQLRRGRLGEEAAIAGPARGAEHRDLAIELENAPVHIRPAGEHGGIVDEIAGRKVVAAVDDEIVAAEEFHARSPR